ncbi:GntR family transcriptional regulator [Actinomadura macrotermitis]|uniref:HTH gntR-type domain-containing protein n=1 Tax=Actinomadura macrotermitis TaxID=2585200 RepID=A0A7K0C0N8_9ACTN|nr:GntR family transcriptional regulator [Actinomadura macrotermitis]MQY07033.1 hypothetical protein [Actinomadura macrotermitis]
MPEQPAWRRIADDLHRRIKEGEFDSGSVPGPARADPRPKLPTEPALQNQYNASRNTVRDAIKWLSDQRIVQAEPGRGTFVLLRGDPFHVTLSGHGGEGDDFQVEAQLQGRVPQDSEPRVEIQKASAQLARQLGVEEGGRLVLRHQQRLIDGEPWSLQTSYYPWRFVEEGADGLLLAADIEIGVVRYLAETIGRRQAGYRDSITCRPPDEHERAFFRLPERGAVAVFDTCRTAYDQHGEPCRLTVTVWPADRNRLHYNIGDVPRQAIAGEPPGRAGDG